MTLDIRHRNWTILLGIICVIALLLPVCCGAISSAQAHHHQGAASHGDHQSGTDAQSCDCGHELAKDYQKAQTKSGAQVLLLDLPATNFADEIQSHTFSYVPPAVVSVPPDKLDGAALALYLLIELFLN